MMILTMSLFLLITLWILGYGIFIKKPIKKDDHAYYKIAYQEQKQQLDDQLAQKLISQTMYDEQFTLISREFLNRTPATHESSKKSKNKHAVSNRKAMISFTFAAIISVAILLFYWAFVYTSIGQNWLGKESSTKVANIMQIDKAKTEVADLVDDWLARIKNEKLVYEDDIANLKPPKELQAKYLEIIQTLQRKLAKDNLQDIDGLKLLGTLYFNVQAYDMAQTIYEQIESLIPNDDQVLLTIAQLDIANSNGEMTTKARQYFLQAIKNSPDNDSPVMMYAVNLANTGLYEEALEKWQWLKGRYPNTSPIYPIIQKAMAGIESKMLAKKNAKSIMVTIDSDAMLTKDLPLGAVLYVLAKSDLSASSPFLVKRVEITQFPMTITLNDSDRMNPDGKNLHEYEHLVVSARISLTGNASPAPNDIEASPVNVTLAESKVNLRLDRRR